MNEKSRKEWEEQVGFKSVYSEFQEMLIKYEKLGETATSKEEVEQFKKNWSDIAVFKETGEVTLNVKDPLFARISNKEGIYFVESKKYSLEKFNSYDEYLRMVNTENAARVACGGLQIPAGSSNSWHYYSYKESAWGSPFKYKLETELAAWNRWWSASASNSLDIYVKIRTYKRGFLGFWYPFSSNSTINATGLEYFNNPWLPNCTPTAPLDRDVYGISGSNTDFILYDYQPMNYCSYETFGYLGSQSYFYTFCGTVKVTSVLNTITLVNYH